MSFLREWRKIKRTGFLPAFWGGGLAAAAVPAVNMAFRWERYVSLNASPVQILLSANGQMMAMLNVLLIVAGACMLYHLEYADNAMGKMGTLPEKEEAVFFGKAAVLLLGGVFLLAIEAGSVFGCAVFWFGGTRGLLPELLKHFGFSFLLLLPAMLLSLGIASLCNNLWMALGMGLLGVFLATMLPRENFGWTLFPYALPFQRMPDPPGDAIYRYTVAAGAETALLALLEVGILKIRRRFL